MFWRAEFFVLMPWAQMKSLIVNVEFFVNSLHDQTINEDKGHKDIDGTLLSKPEAKRKAGNFYGIQLIDKYDAEPIGDHCPDGKQDNHQ
jgi:hypothetical protein